MKLIQTKTLESISHHKNKVIRLASYLLESESDYIIQKMGEVTPESNITDVVTAINQDLANTAKFVNSLAKVIQTVDKNDVSTELDNGETNFTKIFPDHYEAGQMEVFGVSLSRVNGAGYLKADEIKNKIFKHAFPDHKFDDFKALVKLINKAVAQGEVTPEMSFETRLAKVSQIHALEAFKPFVKDVLSSAEKNFAIRMQMSDKDKMTIDQKVMGGRAMIDGVTLSSTYINKTDGVVQKATSHKSQSKLLSDIKGMVDNLPYLKAVEIDPDTDLQKFHDMVQSLENMRFSNSEPFELKSRKLGNYGASGINVVTSDGETTMESLFGYANNMLRIVAVDVRTPTSLAHEIAHYSDTELNASSGIRSQMVNHFGDKINRDLLTELYGDKTSGYIMNNREIVARLGEIGFALHQIDFTPGDDTETVLKKAKEWEKNGVDAEGDKKFSVAIVKNMEAYMAKGAHQHDTYSQEIYFRMADWTPEELTMVQDFTQSFYFDMQPDVQKALKERLDKHQTRLTTLTKMATRRTSKRRVRALSEQDIRQKVWGILKHDDDILGKLLEIGAKEGLFEDGEFSHYATIDLSTTFIGARPKKMVDRDLIRLQYQNYANLAKKADEIESIADLSVIRFGAGLMASSVSEKYGMATNAPEIKALLSKIRRTNKDGEVEGIDIDALMRVRTSSWNSLSSSAGFAEVWRENIATAYNVATEGFNRHVGDAAKLESAYPLAQVAYVGQVLVDKGMASEPLPKELVEQVISDDFNMGVIALSDEDRLANRIDELALSVPHQELMDTSHLMFKLGDRHQEAALAVAMCDSGVFEENGITDDVIRSHVNSDKMQALLTPAMGENESFPDYVERIEQGHFSRPANQNYHDVYGDQYEKITSTEKRFGKEIEGRIQPMRTSPLLVVGNIMQEKIGAAGAEKFLMSLADVLNDSPEFLATLDDIANSNVAHYEYQKTLVRGGERGYRSQTATAPESVMIENLLTKKNKPHKDSKLIEVTPTENMKELLKVKLVVDLVTISNPVREEPMSVKALKLSSARTRESTTRIIPVGTSANDFLAGSTTIPMKALKKMLGEVAAKINTPEYEREVYVERNEGREFAVDFQKTMTLLEDAIGSKAYEVFNFSQNSVRTQMPYVRNADALINLKDQMSNYLIQMHRDTFVPVEDLVQERELAITMQRSAEQTRERIKHLAMPSNEEISGKPEIPSTNMTQGVPVSKGNDDVEIGFTTAPAKIIEIGDSVEPVEVSKTISLQDAINAVDSENGQRPVVKKPVIKKEAYDDSKQFKMFKP